MELGYLTVGGLEVLALRPWALSAARGNGPVSTGEAALVGSHPASRLPSCLGAQGRLHGPDHSGPGVSKFRGAMF